MLSQLVLQQYGSPAQILAMQGSHEGESLAPWAHSPWEQVGGPPQSPPEQARLQHCVALVQGEPLASHVLGPHVPLVLHGPVQQGTLGLQVLPSGRHMGLPQVPLTQMSLQHWLGETQDLPSGRHMGLPQTPLVQMPLQQGVAEEHTIPSGRHFGAPHTPLAPQVPEQHCDDALHACPSGKHMGFCSHTPPWQMVVQHCDAEVHAVPTAPHWPPHWPPLQTIVQHSAAVVQGWPSRVHVLLPPPPPPAPAPMSLRPQLATRESPAIRVARNANNQA
jgi:hypothetical protein